MRKLIITLLAYLLLTHTVSAKNCDTQLGDQPKVSDIQRIFDCLNGEIEKLKKLKPIKLDDRASIECKGQKTRFFCATVIYSKSSSGSAVVSVELKNISGKPFTIALATYEASKVSSLLIAGKRCSVEDAEQDIMGLPTTGSYSSSPAIYIAKRASIRVNHSFGCGGNDTVEGTAVLSTPVRIYIADKHNKEIQIGDTISPPPFKISPR